MSRKLKLAAAQVQTIHDPEKALGVLQEKVHGLAAQGVDLVLFPEVFIGGFPRQCTFGASVGSRTAAGREQYLHHFQASVDLGDTPKGAGDE